MGLFEPFDKHDKIAWDMDGTLINGPNAAFFQAYIALTPYKEHHVVTFRGGAWRDNVIPELVASGFRSAAQFITAVHGCPAETYDGFMLLNDPKQKEVITEEARPGLLVHAGDFLAFKGAKAAELGCTLLVDDLEGWVGKGCEVHGVEFFHAHTPVGMTARALAPRA